MNPHHDETPPPRSRPLWAPWRIEYIRQEKTDECFLCDKAAAADADVENLVVARGRMSFLLLNAYPYNSGHVMVAPYRHVADLSDLTAEEHAEMMELVVRIKTIMTQLMNPQGFNYGFNLGAAAGAGVEAHLHGHLVPRWFGDTNFMPVLSGSRVIPEALAHTAAMFRAAWNRG